MAAFGCGVFAAAAYGTAVYAYEAPDIPKASWGLFVGSCVVGVIAGLLGLRVGTFLERARR
jgi:hypothetical protein